MRKFIILITLAFSLTAFANDVLVVKQHEASDSWAISAIHEITFDGKGVNISFLDGETVYYSHETLDMLRFNITPSGIDNLKDQTGIILQDNTIISSTETNGITVYSLNGSIVAQTSGDSLDISHLGNGTYIVQAGNTITKIMKK